VHVITSLEVKDNAANMASLPISSKRSEINSAEAINTETNANAFSSKRKGSFSEDVGIVNEELKDQMEFQKDQFLSKPKKKRRGRKVAKEISTGHGDGGKDLEKLKAVEAAKLNDIPRSRTFLVTVSHQEPHRVDWLDIDPALVSQLHNANRSNASLNIREATSVSKMNETENEGVTNVQETMNLRRGGVDGQMIQQDGARSEGRNLMGTMEPDVSNIVNRAATNLQGIGTNYAPRSGIESQMMREQISQLAGRMGETETTNIPNTFTSTNMWGLGSSVNATTGMEPSVSNVDRASAKNIPGFNANYASTRLGIESQMVGEQMSQLAGRMGGNMGETETTNIPNTRTSTNMWGLGGSGTTGRNAMAAMEPSISINPGTSAANIPGFTANYASGLGTESEMAGGQMPHLGSQNILRYQMDVEQRMRQQNQMNQYPMQVDNAYGTIPIQSQQGGNRMTPSGAGTDGRGFNSVQEMMQYDLEMRQMRDAFQGQIPIDGHQPMAPSMAFNSTTERSDFRTGIRGAARAVAPRGAGSEVGSQMMRTSNPASDLESPDIMIRDIYTGRNVRSIARNSDGLQDTYPETGVGEQTVRGDDSNLAHDEGKTDGKD